MVNDLLFYCLLFISPHICIDFLSSLKWTWSIVPVSESHSGLRAFVLSQVLFVKLLPFKSLFFFFLFSPSLFSCFLLPRKIIKIL